MSEANFAHLSTARKLALTTGAARGDETGLRRYAGADIFRPWATHGALQRTHLLEVAVRIGSALLVIWLIIGAIAGAQRHYYSGSISSCTKASTIVVTILAGPLNYLGVNPKVACHVPQPSGS